MLKVFLRHFVMTVDVVLACIYSRVGATKVCDAANGLYSGKKLVPFDFTDFFFAFSNLASLLF